MLLNVQRRAARFIAQRARRQIERLRTPWPHLEVGPHSYGAVHVVYQDGDPPTSVKIGDYCSIAKGVEFVVGGVHPTDWVSTYPFRSVNGLPGALEDGHPTSHGDIIVGNDVWIARNATILSGVHIGDGAVIATSAVVTRDVRPYSIVAGVPAREMSRRFTDQQVNDLLRIAWWTWPHEELLSIVHLLNDSDVDALIAYGDRRRTSAAVEGQSETEPLGSLD